MLIGANLVGFGEIARHVRAELRTRFADYLIAVILAGEHDELEKLSAIGFRAAMRSTMPSFERSSRKKNVFGSVLGKSRRGCLAAYRLASKSAGSNGIDRLRAGNLRAR